MVLRLLIRFMTAPALLLFQVALSLALWGLRMSASHWVQPLLILKMWVRVKPLRLVLLPSQATTPAIIQFLYRQASPRTLPPKLSPLLALLRPIKFTMVQPPLPFQVAR